MTTARGTTQCDNAGAAKLTPSTADSTEIAGVIMPSPYRSAVPNKPITTKTRRRGRLFVVRGRINAVRARIPPSPWLSARMTRSRYLMVTTITRDQTIKDSTPKMLASMTGIPLPALRDSLNA